MKRAIRSIFLSILLVFTSLFFVACDEETSPVVIDLTGATVAENATLLSVMEERQAEGLLSFTIENGLVTSINGRKNAANSYWMLYTSDAENANEAWGRYTYQEQTLGSAVSGAETLVVKAGEVYVWSYESF